MATIERHFNCGVCDKETHMVVTAWEQTKQVEIFITKEGEKRRTVLGIVLRGDEIDRFINILSQAGEELKED